MGDAQRVHDFDAERTTLVIGPPGTGKTMSLLYRIGEALAEGIPADRILVATYTRAARAEVLARMESQHGLTQADLPWVRTLHSSAARLLVPLDGEFLTDEHEAEFARRHAYRFRQQAAAVSLEESATASWRWRGLPPAKDDVVRAAAEWARLTCRPLVDAVRFGPWTHAPSLREVQRYVELYAAFKATHRVVDYTDLLEQALARELRPDVDVAFCDEAQDMCLLMVRLAASWSAGCARVVLCADADQVLWQHTGVSPDWLVDLAQRVPTETLRQSYRVPRRVQAVAGKIITRNQHRIPARWAPRAADGMVKRLRMDRAMADAVALLARDEKATAFLLVRNRAFLPPLVRELRTRLVPYKAGANGSPYEIWKSTKRGPVQFVDAIATATKLLEGERVECFAVAQAVEAFVPSGELIRWGLKAKLPRKGTTTLDELAVGTLGKWVARLRAKGPVWCYSLGLRAPALEYLERVRVAHEGLLPPARLTVTTIHASKGQEASYVAVLPDMTRATWESYLRDESAENRVFYVACTRARETLVLCEPEGPRAFRWPAVGRQT